MSPLLTQHPLFVIQYSGDPLRSKQYYFVYTHLPPEQHKLFQHVRPAPMAIESNSPDMISTSSSVWGPVTDLPYGVCSFLYILLSILALHDVMQAFKNCFKNADIKMRT